MPRALLACPPHRSRFHSARHGGLQNRSVRFDSWVPRFWKSPQSTSFSCLALLFAAAACASTIRTDPHGTAPFQGCRSLAIDLETAYLQPRRSADACGGAAPAPLAPPGRWLLGG